LPKRGFNNIFASKYNEINLGRVQAAVDDGKLDAKKPVTIEALREAGLIRRDKDGVRLLGHGEIKSKLAFEVTGASASAVKAVEAAGGSVTLKTVTGRERPAGDQVKADRRANKRAEDQAKADAKSGKKPKPKPDQPSAADEAKPEKAEAAAAKPAAPKPEKAAEADAKKPKPKPAAAKKDKS
jgi:large subunit ribosomal protein L15